MIPMDGGDERIYSNPLQQKLESMNRKERREYMKHHGGFKRSARQRRLGVDAK